MATVSNLLDRLRGLDVERAIGLRAASPPVALGLDREEISMVRVRRKRRSPPVLEAHLIHPLDAGVPQTLFEQSSTSAAKLGAGFRELFEASGVKPGRVSVVLPDNLAKVALLNLPERPPSTKQLLEIIRFKMHRAIPFRLNDATLSYQLLPGEGRGVTVLVAAIRQALVERYEQALESVSARPGLIDLCTPNLLNLCRRQMEAIPGEGDIALLNCTKTYFSLVILREGRMIFFRCKTWSLGDAEAPRTNGLLAREMGSSLSYYREKLAGGGIRGLVVRTIAMPFEELRQKIEPLEMGAVQPIDASARLVMGEGVQLDQDLAQRLAPVIGAAVGRG